MSRAQASRSTVPSARIGVTRATRLPENMGFLCIRGGSVRCYERSAHRGKSSSRAAGERSRSLRAPGTLRYAKRTAHANANLQMKQHLAVSAIGSDRTGMVHELTRVISESGGNISESRMASLGNEFAMLLLVSGNWHALAKLETE